MGFYEDILCHESWKSFIGLVCPKRVTEKAETFLKEMLNVGKSNSSTWEIIAESHIKESRISDALSCLEKAFAEEGSSFWRPKPMNISVLKEHGLLEVLRKVGVLEDDLYMSFLPFYTGSKAENVKVSVGGDDEEAADMLLNELQASI
ncbi:Pentatricopeptide repeat-containing protein [Artemisia annua]|uniref:Pentatricopeptide repeat-containing protein n=1 Tax=Artemisia annua TaxID=35608 RepID=A0A2U1LKK7_ARTAN|nr:Pentatricopeptide repeat-containing protein [Artemisia annua]